MRRKLQDEVSEGRHVAGTVHLDRGTVPNDARVLATDGVVPQCRCRDGGRDIRQTDDEIVRSVGLTVCKHQNKGLSKLTNYELEAYFRYFLCIFQA